MPLQRRLPKRGFTNIFKKHYAIVNLADLAELQAGQTVTPETLYELGIVKKLGDGIKILGDGELRTPLTISAHLFSSSALEKIRQAGGKAEVISAC